MASLSTKKDYWRITFYNSKRSPKSKDLYYKQEDFTERQIQEVKRDLEYEFKHGTFDPWKEQDKEGILLSEAIEIYKKEKRRLAEVTYQNREYGLNALKRDYGNRELTSLPDNYWEDYINEPDKYKTREARRTLIYSLYKRLNKEGYDLPLNIEIIGKSKEKKLRSIVTTQQWITVKEMELLIKAIPELAKVESKKAKAHREPVWEMEDIIRLGFYTGMRRADIFNMRPSWIRDDNKLVRIGGDYNAKSQLPEEIMPTIPEARPILQKLKDESKGNKPFFKHTADYYSKTFKKLVRLKLKKKADNLWFHCLRHSFVMYCMDELKLRDRLIMQLTRHKDERSLRKYKHHNIDSALEELG